jgi:hypothetical protein
MYEMKGGIRNILTFITNKVLPALGLSLEIWPSDVAYIVSTKLANKDMLETIYGAGTNAKRQGQWIQIFCDYRENPKIGNYPSSACPYVK